MPNEPHEKTILPSNLHFLGLYYGGQKYQYIVAIHSIMSLNPQ
jgi:hypothetical protein